jgi:hypothetical protein
MRTDWRRLAEAYRKQADGDPATPRRTAYRLAAMMCHAADLTELCEAPDEWGWPDNLEGFNGE